MNKLGRAIEIAATAHTNQTDRGGSPYILHPLWVMNNVRQMISHNELARAVKLKDLEHNSRITRIKGLRKKDFDRLEKYHKAYTITYTEFKGNLIKRVLTKATVNH